MTDEYARFKWETLHKFIGGDEFCALKTLMRKGDKLRQAGVIYDHVCGRPPKRHKTIMWFPSKVRAYFSALQMRGEKF